MGVPERLRNIKELQTYFQKFNIPVTLCIDNQYKGIWWNAKRAWSTFAGRYHLVLQDDAHICNKETFISNLHLLINFIQENHDAYIACLYSHFWKPEELIGKTGLLSYRMTNSAVGTLMSRTNVMRMLRFVDSNIPNTLFPTWDDERIASWQLFSNTRSILPIPMLIYHDELLDSTTEQGKLAQKIRTEKINTFDQNNLLGFPGNPISTNIIKIRSHIIHKDFLKIVKGAK